MVKPSISPEILIKKPVMICLIGVLQSSALKRGIDKIKNIKIRKGKI